MRRSGRLRRRNEPRRRASLQRRQPLRRNTPLRLRPASPASEAQRAKVAGQSCLVCGRRPVDPAHLVPRSVGGCDDPDCCIPLCRGCHRRYDRGELDLLAELEPRYRAELAHALAHLSLLSLLRLVTGTRWRPDNPDIANREERR